MSQWYKTTNSQTGAYKLRQSLQARLALPQLKDICTKVRAHCPVCQARNPAKYKSPGNSQFYPFPSHPFESVCIHVFSMPGLTVRELGTIGSTSTPCNAVLMCVDRHSGYIVAAPTTKEGFTGQRAGKLLYRNWFTVFEPPHDLVSDKGRALVSSWFKSFCHPQGVHKAESVAYLSRSNGGADNAGRQLFDTVWLLRLRPVEMQRFRS